MADPRISTRGRKIMPGPNVEWLVFTNVAMTGAVLI